MVPVFNEYGDTDIQIFGYTDNTGKPEYNLTLSGQRAASVQAYLVSKGLKSNRFKTSGLGIVDPVSYTHLRAHETRIGISVGVLWV